MPPMSTPSAAVLSALMSQGRPGAHPRSSPMIEAMTEIIRQLGRGPDSQLAHVTPREAEMLKAAGGSGTRNPVTGLPEFGTGGGGSPPGAPDRGTRGGVSDTGNRAGIGGPPGGFGGAERSGPDLSGGGDGGGDKSVVSKAFDAAMGMLGGLV